MYDRIKPPLPRAQAPCVGGFQARPFASKLASSVSTASIHAWISQPDLWQKLTSSTAKRKISVGVGHPSRDIESWKVLVACACKTQRGRGDGHSFCHKSPPYHAVSPQHESHTPTTAENTISLARPISGIFRGRRHISQHCTSSCGALSLSSSSISAPAESKTGTCEWSERVRDDRGTRGTCALARRTGGGS